MKNSPSYLRKVSSKFFTLAILFLMLEISSSCNRIFEGCTCPTLRRPPVMTGFADNVIDYNAALEGGVLEACSEDEEECADEKSELYRKISLTPDDFNPWKPLETDLNLSVGDVLKVGIFGDEDTFFNQVIVAPDGRLYYTFIDGIPAAGRKINEVADEMQDRLKEYFLDPIVTITPIFAAEQSYRIFGRVRQPGVFPLVSPLHLREAIGEAGGLLQEDFNSNRRSNEQLEELVDLKESFLVRKGKKLDIDFLSLMREPTSKQDIFIKPGDYIYIASHNPQQVYVLGAVRGPQRLEYQRGMTLMEALADSGGWTWGEPYSSDISRVMVIRGDLHCPVVLEADVTLILHGEARDIALAPGDIIYVMNKTMRFGRALVRIAISTFIQSFATAAGSYYAQFEWLKIGFPEASDSH